jgi:SSS family solute:Na+ symporter
MVLPGTMARVIFPDLTNPDMVYPKLMLEMLPVGLLGLVIAGFLAALMSQIDSTLNSASTLVTMDFVKRFRPQTQEKTLLWVGRSVTVFFMLFAIFWAPQIEKFQSLWDYLQQVLAYLTPPVVAVFVWGIFWKKATPSGAFVSLMTGLVISLFLLITGNAGWMPEIHFLYVAFILFVVSTVILFVSSYFTKPADPEVIKAYTWSRRTYQEETEQLRGLPWYRNYRILSGVLLVFTAIIVIIFW